MLLQNLSHEELIAIFKVSIEEQANRSKSIAARFYSEIYPNLMLLTNDIQNHADNLLHGEVILNEPEKQQEILNSVVNDLQKIIATIYPVSTRRLGLIQTLENSAKTNAHDHSINICFLSNPPLERFYLPDAQSMHINMLFDAVLDLLLTQCKNDLTVQIDCSDKLINLKFRRLEFDIQVNSDDLSNHFLNSKIKSIQARVLLLNAKVDNQTDWMNTIEFAIPK